MIARIQAHSQCSLRFRHLTKIPYYNPWKGVLYLWWGSTCSSNCDWLSSSSEILEALCCCVDCCFCICCWSWWTCSLEFWNWLELFLISICSASNWTQKELHTNAIVCRGFQINCGVLSHPHQATPSQLDLLCDQALEKQSKIAVVFTFYLFGFRFQLSVIPVLGSLNLLHAAI